MAAFLTKIEEGVASMACGSNLSSEEWLRLIRS